MYHSDALRIFQLYDPVRGKHFPKQILNFGYFELLKPNVETENQRQWQNYFLQKPLSDNAPGYIKDALHIIDRANIDEEELDMMAKVEYYRSIFDNQIHYARNEGWNEGRNEGRNEGMVDVAREMLTDGEPIDKIIRYTRFTVEEIERLNI